MEPRSPAALDVLVLFGTTLGLVAVAHEAGLPHLFGRNAALGLSALSTVMVGVPALAWALDRGRGSALALVLAGAAAGTAAPFILMMGGMVRVLVLGGPDSLMSAIAYGAVVPGRGPLAWSRFLMLMAESASIGALTGLVIRATGRTVRRNP